jgi:hypothetical protein
MNYAILYCMISQIILLLIHIIISVNVVRTITETTKCKQTIIQFVEQQSKLTSHLVSYATCKGKESHVHDYNDKVLINMNKYC